MLSYKDYEKKVYDWLMSKNKIDPNFTFSVRRNGTKGAKTDYFIGTEKSKYFATTFWEIRVGFPGSSSDCIDLLFGYDQDDFKYWIEFTQTNSPHNLQNTSALNLIKSLREPISSAFGLKYDSGSDKKMFSLIPKTPKEKYASLEEMLVDVEKDLEIIIPLVDEFIKKEKEKNSEFLAHRITPAGFEKMQERMARRIEKYTNINTSSIHSENLKSEFIDWLVKNPKSDYFDNDKQKIESELDDCNKFFDVDIFQCSSENYQSVIHAIKSKLYGQDENDFILFSEERGNHRPRAILGKRNYLKFLNEKFNISEESKGILSNEINFPLNTIFYGPPGTGKTYNTILRSAEIIENRTIEEFTEAKRIFNKHLGERIEFITFHQNYSYEDFIQGLRPDTENDKELTFEKKDGIFKVIADKALKNIRESEEPTSIKKPFNEVFNSFFANLNEGEVEELEIPMKKVSYFVTGISNKSISFRKASGGTEHTLSISTLKKMYDAESILDIQGLSSYYSPLLSKLLTLGKISNGKNEKIEKQNFVIVIDEINRANISRVFGELITLIEKDKRSNGDIPLKCTLPSGEEFVVPSNLYIIGTMNTADKSIALLDIALRRRFEFESMYPKYEIEGEKIYDVEILKKINKKIIDLKGHDFQIGHAYFMGENNNLVQRMNKKVIPLLLEYFMNDDKEVKSILSNAGLEIEEDSWPLKVTGIRA